MKGADEDDYDEDEEGDSEDIDDDETTPAGRGTIRPVYLQIKHGVANL